MKTIYKTGNSKSEVLKLYDSQMSRLGYAYKDIFIDTSFGKTHLVETGNPKGPALLVFHGGNSTTAYNLLICRFLLEDFHVYAPDIVGHPGKSAQTSLPPWGYRYGRWAVEVIDGLGFDKMNCFGCSFGGGVLAKLMCAEPQKVGRSVLFVPAGIHNAIPVGSAKMMIPLVRYVRTGDEEYIRQAALFMAVTEDVLDEDTIDTVKSSFTHVRTKVGMPGNVSGKKMKACAAPTLVIAGEKDILFPARKVLKRAKKIIPDCTLYELKSRGHMHVLTEREKEMIVRFLKKS